MQAQPSFEGVIPPVVTPFSLDGELDLDGLATQLGWLAGRGLSGILVVGSTGEAPLLSREERRLAVERAAALKEDGALLMAGTGAQSTRETIRLTEDAAHAGAEAVLVLNPSYYSGLMTVDALEDHYRSVADHSPVPVFLYNVPMFTGLPLSPELVERLAGHENIVGMKDSSGDLRNLQVFLERTPPDFQVLNGNPFITGAAALSGVSGVILAVGNLFPELCVALFEAGRKGDVEAVRELQTSLNALTRATQVAHGIPGLKAAADLLGGCGGLPRLPIRPASEDARREMAAVLSQAGFELASPAVPD